MWPQNQKCRKPVHKHSFNIIPMWQSSIHPLLREENAFLISQEKEGRPRGCTYKSRILSRAAISYFVPWQNRTKTWKWFFTEHCENIDYHMEKPFFRQTLNFHPTSTSLCNIWHWKKEYLYSNMQNKCKHKNQKTLRTSEFQAFWKYWISLPKHLKKKKSFFTVSSNSQF